LPERERIYLGKTLARLSKIRVELFVSKVSSLFDLLGAELGLFNVPGVLMSIIHMPSFTVSSKLMHRITSLLEDGDHGLWVAKFLKSLSE